MKRFVLSMMLCTALMFASGCTRVEPGWVGIKVNMYGSQKGVEDFPLKTGRVFYNPFTEEVYEYPTFMQNQAWTETATEGSPNNEAITFNSVEGSSITVDVGLNYTIDPELVPHMFIEFRQSVDTITHGYLRNQVRDAFNRVAGQYKAIEIFGEKKQALLDAVKADLDHKLREKGFLLDTVSFISAPRADAEVMRSITLVIKATQDAIAAENMVRQVEAEAKQAKAKADGVASAILAEAEAQAKANTLVNATLTPQLIQYKLLEQWDGVAPKVLGTDSNLLLNMDAN